MQCKCTYRWCINLTNHEWFHLITLCESKTLVPAYQTHTCASFEEPIFIGMNSDKATR